MPKKRILIVEDNRIVAEDLWKSLENIGYAVASVASSGETAIKKAEESKPDLVLVDIVLKGKMDGIEAAEKIRCKFNIPIVYITAYSDDTILKCAKITEPFGYIIKPFKERDLQINIEIALYKYKIDKELKESKSWYLTTLKSIGDAVITADSKGCVMFMNPVAELLTGWSLKDALGKPLDEVYNTVDEKTGCRIQSPVINAAQNDITFNHINQTVLIDKYSIKVPVEDRCDPIKDEKGNIIGIVLVFRDITERRHAEEEIQRRSEIQTFLNQLLRISIQKISLEEVLDRVIKHITSISWLAPASMGGIWMVEDQPDLLILKAQRGFPMSLQSTCASIPFGRCICGRAALSGEIEFADYADKHHEVMEQGIIPHGHCCIPLVSSGRVIGIINLFLKEGHQRNLREDDFLHAMANVIVGIIQRKQGEEALVHSNEFSRTVINSMNNALSIVNVHDFRITGLNSVFLREVGLKEEEVIGKTCYEITHLRPDPCKSPGDTCPLLETAATGKYSVAEHIHYGIDGMKKYVEVSTSPIINDKGKIAQVVHVSRDITERKLAEERLKLANIELMRADEIKTQFLNISSHELRTPLTPIRAQLQIILAGYLGEVAEKQKESLDIILRNTTRLDRLIGDILDVSKLEAGAMTFIMDRAGLNETVESVVKNMKPRAKIKNITITLKENNIPEMVFDKDRIAQVIVTLIDNAIKFTDSGGHVEVELFFKNENAFIKVIDNGIGIKDEDQKKIFKPFVQVDSSYSRQYEGSGLGLSICKGIINYHGGNIWLESEFGKGSTFQFNIPFNIDKNKIKVI